jgi:hypothetical protein
LPSSGLPCSYTTDIERERATLALLQEERDDCLREQEERLAAVEVRVESGAAGRGSGGC